jgi:hypothetical protein
MTPRTPVSPRVTPLGAGALPRVAAVAGALLILWSAIGAVLGWWG